MDAEAVDQLNNVEHTVARLIERARRAMDAFSHADQARVDETVTALAWSVYRPEHAQALAETAVRETGLGNVSDKITKNQRKTFGTLRDLMRVSSVGLLDDDAKTGIARYAKPVGVVAAITPSTNPAATPVNKAMMAVKGGNAVIIAPPPGCWRATSATVELMRKALSEVCAPIDLVQVLPQPVSRALTQSLMKQADMVVATGSQKNVRAAYGSGTPAIGVGAGNVPVIIDSTADLHDAAAKVSMSKVFDNSTSCSSENSLVLLNSVYADMVTALQQVGGYLADANERRKIQNSLWQGDKLNRDLICKDAAVLATHIGLDTSAENARFFMVEESRFDKHSPFADEKLSLVLTLYRARDFDHAISLIRDILKVQGKGHSCGIHTADPANARHLAESIDVVRVLVNQAHTFGNGGSFDNGLNFTLSMGCGTWGGNSISENLNYRHFINITHLSHTVSEDRPSEEELFGQHWTKYGK